MTFLVFIITVLYLRNRLSQRHIRQAITLAEPENSEGLRKGLVPKEGKAGWSQNRARRTLVENGPGMTTVLCPVIIIMLGCVRGEISYPPAKWVLGSRWPSPQNKMQQTSERERMHSQEPSGCNSSIEAEKRWESHFKGPAVSSQLHLKIRIWKWIVSHV